VLFGDGAEVATRAAFAEQATFATEYGSDNRCLVKNSLQGAGGQVQPSRSAAGSTGVGASERVVASAWPARCPVPRTSHAHSLDPDKGGIGLPHVHQVATPHGRYFRKRNIASNTTRNRNGGGGQHVATATPSRCERPASHPIELENRIRH